MIISLQQTRKSIHKIVNKYKPEKAVLALYGAILVICVLVGANGFYLGKMEASEAHICPVSIENVFEKEAVFDDVKIEAQVVKGVGEGQVLGSINSDKYHYPWCSGAGRIKEENKIWFKTEQDAINAGRTKAKNCQ